MKKFRTPHSALRIAAITLLSGLALWQVAEATVLMGLYRRKLYGNGTDVAATTLTHLVVDHASLVTASPQKSRPDGQDLSMLTETVTDTIWIPTTDTPISGMSVGAPDSMAAYHGFDDAATLLPSLGLESTCASDPNLVALWPMDNPITSWTLCPSAGAAGAITGSVALAGVAGEFQRAVSLGGAANTQVAYPLPIANQPESTQTLAFWTYLSAPVTGTQPQGILSQDDGDADPTTTRWLVQVVPDTTVSAPPEHNELQVISDARKMAPARYLCVELTSSGVAGSPSAGTTLTDVGGATPRSAACDGQSFWIPASQWSSATQCGTCNMTTTSTAQITTLTNSSTLVGTTLCASTVINTTYCCSCGGCGLSSCSGTCVPPSCCGAGCCPNGGVNAGGLCPNGQRIIACNPAPNTAISSTPTCVNSCGGASCTSYTISDYLCTNACTVATWHQAASDCGTCSITTGYTCQEPGAGPGTPGGVCNGATWTQPTASCGTCTLANTLDHADMVFNPLDVSAIKHLQLTSTKGIPVQQWTHVAIVVDPTTDSAAIYLNGQNAGSFPNVVTDAGGPMTSWGLPKATPPLAIGMSGSVLPINGLVDGVAYYSRALPAAGILGRYQASVSRNGIDGGATVPLALHTVAFSTTAALGRSLSFTPQPAAIATSSYARASPNPLKGLANWTMELLVNISALPSATQTLVSAWDSNLPTEQYFRVDLDTTGKPQLTIKGSAAVSAPTALTLNQWHHLALIGSSGSTKLSVDGRVVSAAALPAWTASPTPLLIGGYLGTSVTLAGGSVVSVPTAGYSGLLDEFVLHTRALSPSELTARAMMVQNPTAFTPSLVWNPGMGLDRTPIFFTTLDIPVPTVYIQSCRFWCATSYYYLDYGSWPAARLPFCGEPSQNNCPTSRGAASVSSGPVIWGGEEGSPLLSVSMSPATFLSTATTPQAMPTITITDVPGGTVTISGANAGVRLHIPADQLLLLEWDAASVLTATVTASSGSATIATTVDPKVLQVSLASALAANGTITISGLKVTKLSQAGKGYLWIDTNDPVSCSPAASCAEATAASPITSQEVVTISNPATQVANAFSTGGALTNLPLLQFNAQAFGADVNLSKLQLTVSGTALSKLTALQLQQPWSVTGNAGALSVINLSNPLSQGSAQMFTVAGSFSSLALGDTLTISLPVNNTYLVGSGSSTLTNPVPVTGTAVSMTHTYSGFTVSLSPNPSVYKIGDTVTVGWVPVPAGGPGPVTNVDLLVGTTVLASCAPPASTATSCSLTLPNTATALNAAKIRVQDAAGNQGFSSAFTLAGTLTIGPHSQGQAPATLTVSATPITTDLFRFHLTTHGEAVTLSGMTFGWSSNGTVVASDLTNLKLYQAGSPLTGTLAIIASTITYTGSLSISGTQDFILKADVAQVLVGDTLTLNAFSSTGVSSPTGGTSSSLVTVSGSVAALTHTAAGFTVTLAPAQTLYKIGDPLTVSWTTIGPTQAVTNVDLLVGTTVLASCASLVPPATSCSLTLPMTATALNAAKIRVQDAAGNQGFSSAFTVAGTLTIGPHSQGQAAAILGVSATAVTNDLFHFRLTANGEAITLSGMTFGWTSSNGGVLASDFTNAKLYQGATQVGSVGTVGASTIGFSFSTPITMSGGQDFSLQADIANVIAGDILTLNAFSSSSVSAPTGSTSTITPVSVTGSVAALTHTAAGFTVTLAPAQTLYKIGDPLTVSWISIGSTQAVTNVDLLVGTTVLASCASLVPPATSCSLTLPMTATALNAAKIRVQDAAGNQGFSSAFTLAGTLTLGPHSQGQAPATLTVSATPITTDLFRFNLTTNGEAVTLSGMTFGWSSNGTVVASDLTNLKLYQAGSPLTGTLAIIASTITYTGSLSISGTQDFILKADVAQVLVGDTLTLNAFSSTGVSSPTGGTSTSPVTVSGSVAALTHTAAGFTVTLAPAQTLYKIGDSLTVSWSPIGSTGTVTNVDALVSGTSLASCATVGATSCLLTLPTATAPNGMTVRVKDAIGNQGFSSAFTVAGTLTLSGSTQGQAPNAFTNPPNATGQDLFRCKLTATGEPVTLTGMTFSWTGSGVVPGDLSNLKLYQAGSPLTGTLAIIASTITYTGPLSVSGSQDFTLNGNVANIALGDLLQLNLAAAGGLASPRGSTSGIDLTTLSGAVSGSVLPATHTASGYTVTLNPPQTLYKIGDPVTVSWTKLGNPNTSVHIDYFVSGVASGVCGPQPTTASSCAFTMPNTATATSAAQFRVQDTVDPSNQGLSPTFTVAGTLALGAHSQGQAPNAFTSIPTSTNVELFRFKLSAVGEQVNLSGLTLTWSGTGVVAADLSNLTLFLGGVTQVGGTPTVTSTTMAFGPLSVPSGGQDIVLRGDVTNLAGGDAMTINLVNSNLASPAGATSGVALGTLAGAVTGTVAGVTHTASGYTVTLSPTQTLYKIGDPLTVSWTTIGSPGTSATVDYMVGGAAVSRVCQTATTSCQFSLPTTATAATAAQFRVQDAGNAGYQGTSAKFTVAGTLTLGEATTGQPANAFTQLPDAKNAALYRFKLTPTGEAVDLLQLTIGLSATGIAPTEITDLTLFKDGTPVTATFAVNATQMSATLTGVNLAGAAEFTLQGSVATLAVGDEMTLSLLAAGIKPKGTTSQADLSALAGAVLGSVSSNRHFVKTYSITSPAAGANWPVLTTQNIQWTAVGGANASNVTILYSTDGGATYLPMSSGTSLPNPFPWLPPLSAISTQAKVKIVDNTDATAVGYSGGTTAGNYFNITGAISITAPTQDLRYADSLIRWPVGKPQTIQWTTKGAMSQFRVFVGATELNGSPTTTTSLSFTPSVPSAAATIKVADSSPGHPPSEATKQVVFSQIQLLQPNTTSVWPINRPQTIQWAQTGLETVDISYTTDGTTFIPLATNIQASLGSYAWSPVSAAVRSPHVQVEIRDHIDPTNGAKGTSSPFKVVGQLVLTDPTNTLGVNAPYTIQWTTPNGPVPNVSLYLVDAGANTVTPIVTNQNNTGSFIWTPRQTIAQAKLRICDADFPNDDPDACDDTVVFSIAGIAVTSPAAGTYLVNDPVTIAWTQVGVAGGAVNLSYAIDGSSTFTPIATNVPTGLSGTYQWKVPDAISSQVIIRVTAALGQAFGDSPILAISGRLTLTGPVTPNNIFTVTGTMPMTWTTLGTIPLVNLEYSLDGGAHWLSMASGVSNVNTYAWDPIPLNVISDQVVVHVVDAAGTHPFTEGRSDTLHVGAKFTLSSPAGGENWAVNKEHAVGWSVLGEGVTSIRLAYSGDGTTYTDIGIVSLSGASGEAKTYDWTVADLVAAMGDPQVTPRRPFTIRITDATAGHPTSPTVSASLTAFYYQVKWQIKDLASGAILNSLQVLDSTGWTNAPAFDYSGLQTHYYPYFSQVSTLWALSNNNGSSDLSQGPADTAPISIWKSDQNQTRVVLLEPASADAVTWQVKSGYNYDAPTNLVEFSTWLEKSGKIVDTPLPDYGAVQLYEDGNLIRELPQPLATGTGQTPDANGNIRITWDLKREDGTTVPDGKTYFAKVIIHRAGRTFSTGGSLNITIPKKIQALPTTSGSSGGSGGTGTTDPALAADVSAIKTAVTQTLPQQIAIAQVAIQSNVTAAKDQLSAQVTDVKTDTATIRTQTDKISTQVIPKLDGVQSYLEDPARGLPAVLSRQDQTIDQLKDAKKGHLVNRNMVIEQGDQALIRYVPADPASVPTIKIFGPAGFAAIGPVSMAPNNGIFEWNQFFAGAPLGEYTVTVAEPASTNSNGTLDTMTLYVRQPVATAKRVDDAMTVLTDLTGQLTNIETQINTLTPSLLAVQTATNATRTLAQQIAADTQQLLAKWGTADAQQLKSELDSLYARIGAPASGTLAQDVVNLSTQVGTPMQKSDLTSLQTAITNLTALVNSLPSQFPDISTLQNTLNGLVTKVGTPTTGSIASDIQDVRAAIAALTGGTGGSGGTGGGDLTTVVAKLDALGAKLTALQAQVNDPAQRDRLETVLTTIQTVQTDMAKEQTLDQVKNSVGQMSGTLSAMDARVGTPLQQSDLAGLQTAVTQLTTLVQSLPTTFPDYTNKLNGIQTVLDTMNVRVGTPLQQSDLTGLQAAVTQLTNLVQSLPTTFPDYTTQLNQLQTMLSQLTQNVGTPVQQSDLAGLQTAVANLTTLVNSLPSTFPNYQSDLTAIKTALSQLSLDMGRPIQQSALTGFQSAVTQLTSLVQSLPTTFPDYTTQLQDVQTKLGFIVSKMGSPLQQSDLPGLQNSVNQLVAAVSTLPKSFPPIDQLQTSVDQLNAAVAKIPTADTSSDLQALKSSLADLQTKVAAGSQQATTPSAASGGLDNATLLAKLETLQKSIESAQGSGAAVSFAQSASASAKEAADLLHQLQVTVQGGGPHLGGSDLLKQLNEKLSKIAESVSAVPDKMTMEKIRKQLDTVAERVKTVSSEKGYKFDALYESHEVQAGDVKTVRNRVEELKSLLDLQRAILEQKLNQPTVKTWFESGP